MGCAGSADALRDNARDDLRGNEGWDYARKLLGIMAPHVIAQRKTQDEDAATTDAIRGRLTGVCAGAARQGRPRSVEDLG